MSWTPATCSAQRPSDWRNAPSYVGSLAPNKPTSALVGGGDARGGGAGRREYADHCNCRGARRDDDAHFVVFLPVWRVADRSGDAALGCETPTRNHAGAVVGRRARAPPRIPRRLSWSPRPARAFRLVPVRQGPTVAGQRRTLTGFPRTQRLRGRLVALGCLRAWHGHGGTKTATGARSRPAAAPTGSRSRRRATRRPGSGRTGASCCPPASSR